MSSPKKQTKLHQRSQADAVGLVVEQGYSSAEVGRRLGVSENNDNRWARQYRDKNEQTSSEGLTREQMEAELKRL